MRIDIIVVGDHPRGARTPFSISRHFTQRPSRLLRKREGRDILPTYGQVQPRCLRRHQASQNRFARSSLLAPRDHAVADGRGNFLGMDRADGNENDNQRIHLARLEDRLHGLAKVIRACGSDHVHRIGQAGSSRKKGREPAPGLSGQLRNRQPARLTTVGAEDPGAAGIRHDSDPASGRQRLAVQKNRDIKHLIQCLGANDSGLTEEGIDSHVARRQGRRVGPGGASASECSARLHADDRLFAAHPAGDTRKAARIAERLEVKQDDSGVVVLLPVLEQVVAGDIRLVAHADERGKSQPALAGKLENRDAERAALRRHGHLPRRREDGRERGVEPDFRIGIDHAQAVGPDHPHAVAPHFFDQLLLQLPPFTSNFGESRRDHDERLHSPFSTLVDDVKHPLAGNRDDGQVDCLRQLAHRRIGPHRADHGGHGIDGVDRSLEAVNDEGLEDPVAYARKIARRPNDRDRARLKNRAQGGGGKNPIAHFGAVHAGLRRHDREIDLHVAAIEALLDLEPGMTQDLDHPPVLRHRERPEMGDAVTHGQQGQPLQEQRAQSFSLKGILHHYADLGGLRVPRKIGAGGDDGRPSLQGPANDERELGAGIGAVAQ